MNNPINAQFLQQYAQGKSYGPEFKFVYDAFRNAGVKSLVGPDVLFNYQAQLYDGDALLPLNQPLITESGLASGEWYTNLLPEGAEDFSTWAIPSGGSTISDNGDGTYTVNTTATSGRTISQAFIKAEGVYGFGFTVKAIVDTTITYRGVLSGSNVIVDLVANQEVVLFSTLDNSLSLGYLQFFDSSDQLGDTIIVSKPFAFQSSYHHDYIPPGTTQPSMIGSTDNGMRVPIEEYVDGVLKPKQQALRNLFRGTPDGVELVTNGEMASTDGLVADGWNNIRGSNSNTNGIQRIENPAGNSGVITRTDMSESVVGYTVICRCLAVSGGGSVRVVYSDFSLRII